MDESKPRRELPITVIDSGKSVTEEAHAHHHDHADEQGAHEAPGYEALTAVIKAGCRLAIKVSEKV